jgi:hypothetical protein
MFTGPIVLLFLILPGVVLSFKVFFPKRSIYGREKHNLKIISAVGIACLTGMIITTAIMRHVRTDADFILKYEYSYQGESVLNKLLYQRSSKLNELREIVRRGKNSRIIAMAGENIAAYGDSMRDVPLLLEAYARIYGNDEDETVEKALSKMTGISLPEGSPPEKWRKHWNLNAKIQIQPIFNENGK